MTRVRKNIFWRFELGPVGGETLVLRIPEALALAYPATKLQQLALVGARKLYFHPGAGFRAHRQGEQVAQHFKLDRFRTALDWALKESSGSWIQTYTGRKVDVLSMSENDVDIEDIGHALANQCRFSGHCKFFYSVAQHSVLISEALPPDLAKEGLLHDAAEAYLQDMVTPLKRHTAMGGVYESYEWHVMSNILSHFGLWAGIPSEVKVMDQRILITEAQALMAPVHPDWPIPPGLEALDIEIQPWTHEEAKARFLARYAEVR